VALLKEQPLDFGNLLEDLLLWNHPDKPSQNRWARDFYRTFEPMNSSTLSPDTKEPQS
jgi:CRISPR system Cascade subunit CasB